MRRPFWLVIAVVSMAAGCGESRSSSATTADPAPDATSPTTPSDIVPPSDAAPATAASTATTVAAADGALSFVVLDDSEVDAEDLDVRDLVGESRSGLLFLTSDGLVFAGVVAGRVEVTLLAEPRVDTLSDVASPVALCGDIVIAVVAGEGADAIVAMDVARRSERWRVEAPHPDGGHGVACGTEPIVVTDDDAGVVGLSAADGSVVWTSTIDAIGPPLGAGDRAVIAADDGVVVLDIASGRELWRTNAASAALVAGAQGVLIEQDAGPTLYSSAGERVAEYPTLSDVLDDGDGTALDLEAVRIAGRDDDLVLVLVERPFVVDLTGALVRLGLGVGAAVGVSEELIWTIGATSDGIAVSRTALDGTPLESVVVDTEFNPVAASELVVFGGVEGVPALVVREPGVST